MAIQYLNVFDNHFEHHIIAVDDSVVNVDTLKPVCIDVSDSVFAQTFTCPRLQEIKNLLEQGFLISALNLALLLPDICSNIEREVNKKYIGFSDADRYEAWFNDYIYNFNYGDAAPTHKFDCFNGKMCYALRCKMVHGCNDNIEDMPNHKKSKIKEKYSHVYFCFTQGKSSFAVSTDNENIVFVKSIYQLVMQIISMAESYYKNPNTQQFLSNGFFLDSGPIRDYVYHPGYYDPSDLLTICQSIQESKKYK